MAVGKALSLNCYNDSTILHKAKYVFVCVRMFVHKHILCVVFMCMCECCVCGCVCIKLPIIEAFLAGLKSRPTIVSHEAKKKQAIRNE